MRYLILILCAYGSLSPEALAQGRIEGQVLDAATEEPLPGANVRLGETQRGAATDAEGHFVIENVPAGTHQLVASMLGFEAGAATVTVPQGATATVTLRLTETYVPLREVVVTPGRFTVMQAQPTAAQTLNREDIQGLPQLGEDIYRAVRRLPGLTSNDFSAGFHIRGGHPNEVLVLLDGMELYEPFHLKDIGGGGLSVLDVEAIGGIDMMTGAFPAPYGNRLSGVFSIDAATPVPGQMRTSLGLSFTNARFLTEGRFADDRGTWLVLARRGYLDIILAQLDDESGLSPTYYDVLAKTSYRLAPQHQLSAHLLIANDDLELIEEADTFDTGYSNAYGWVTWDATWSPRLFARTLAFGGRLSERRDAFNILSATGGINYIIADDRGYDVWGVQQDWTWDAGARHLISFGAQARTLTARYDYDLLQFVGDDDQGQPQFVANTIRLRPDGTRLGAYVSHRLRLADPLTVEGGLRYDRYSWTDDQHVSPRVNAALALGRTTVLRGGWGYFHQAQGIQEIDVQDGEEEFYPAERAEHRMLGLEQRLPGGLQLRLDLYQKKLTNQRPYYFNLEDATTDFFPEVSGDRVRAVPLQGEARGFEVLLQKRDAGRFTWWASYSYAVAEDEYDVGDGAVRTFPRPYDQRHTVFLDLNYQPNAKWRVSTSWQYRSGAPVTFRSFDATRNEDGSYDVRSFYELDEVLANRMPAFHRMDIRVSRYFSFRTSRLAVFAEVSNLYDRDNVRRYGYNLSIQQGQLVVDRVVDEVWLPRLPSIGVSWDFFR